MDIFTKLNKKWHWSLMERKRRRAAELQADFSVILTKLNSQKEAEFAA